MLEVYRMGGQSENVTGNGWLRVEKYAVEVGMAESKIG
jgi:hypothetical protein